MDEGREPSLSPQHPKPVYEIRAGALARLGIGELWHNRHLALLLAGRNIRVRYKQTVLGLAWALLAPVAYTFIFLLFFQLAPIAPTGKLPLVPTVFAGMALWQFFSRALGEAGTSLSANANLITKVYFPRLVLPLSAIIASLADLAVSFLLLVLLLVWYGVTPGWPMLLAPLWVLYTFVLALGCSLWLSAMDGLYRDLRHAVPLILQLGMFASPVGYTTTGLVPDAWRWLYELNPMVLPLEGLRWSLIPGSPLSGAGLIAQSVAITLLLLIAGTMFFSRTEQTVVDRV
jgi:lipopolysaccharide transport system permease protein